MEKILTTINQYNSSLAILFWHLKTLKLVSIESLSLELCNGICNTRNGASVGNSFTDETYTIV